MEHDGNGDRFRDGRRDGRSDLREDAYPEAHGEMHRGDRWRGGWAYRPAVGPAGFFLGLGLGGFVDGIILHQIFQWHGMLSARLPLDNITNIRTNMVADGLFQLLCWLATLIGIALLWRTLNRPHEVRAAGRSLIGWMLAGWGWFQLVEGLVNHFLLGLHHVVEMLGLSLWDWLHLGWGVVLIIIGHGMARSARRWANAYPVAGERDATLP